MLNHCFFFSYSKSRVHSNSRVYLIPLWKNQNFCIESWLDVYLLRTWKIWTLCSSIRSSCSLSQNSRSLSVIVFFDKNIISTVKWMKKLKHELIHYKINDVISSAKFLNCINFLLIDDATKWAETNSNTARILIEKNSSQEFVIAFRNLFCERFFAKFIETSIVNFDTELNELRQTFDEFINIYYKRLTALMLRVKVKNRVSSSELSLFLLKFIILDVIMKSFVRDFINDDIRKKIIRELIMIDKSLKELCNLTKDANKVKKNFKNLWRKKTKQENWIFTKKWLTKTFLAIEFWSCWHHIKLMLRLQTESWKDHSIDLQFFQECFLKISQKMFDIQNIMKNLTHSDRNKIISMNSILKDSCSILSIRKIKIQKIKIQKHHRHKIKILDQIQCLTIEDLNFINSFLKICLQLKLLSMNLLMGIENDYQKMNFFAWNAKNRDIWFEIVMIVFFLHENNRI